MIHRRKRRVMWIYVALEHSMIVYLRFLNSETLCHNSYMDTLYELLVWIECFPLESDLKPHHMLEKKNKRYCLVGILTYNTIVVNDTTVEWIDGKDFSLASVARLLGLDENKNLKAKITLEIAEEPCELCGKMTTGDKLCLNCGKMVCDQCAKTDGTGDRYCPICYDLRLASKKML